MQPIIEGRFQDASFARNIWSVVLPHDVPFEDLENPAFWAHVVRKLRVMDRIEVYREDGTEWAELLVTLTDRVSAKVVVLNRVSLEKAIAEDVDPEYAIGWAGPHHKYRVVRISDKQVVQAGFASADAAQKWLAEYTKALAA